MHVYLYFGWFLCAILNACMVSYYAKEYEKNRPLVIAYLCTAILNILVAEIYAIY